MFGDTRIPFDNAAVAALFPPLIENDAAWTGAVNAAKDYLDTYFARCLNPVSALFWSAHDRRVQTVRYSDLKNILVAKKVTRTLDSSKHEFDAYALKYFLGTERLYALTCDMTKPLMFDEDGQSYVNMFGGFLHEDAPPLAEPTADVQLVLDHIRTQWCSRGKMSFTSTS